MRTLAMMKMEKNFIAHNEKKQPRKPYVAQTIRELLCKLSEERLELIEAWKQRDIQNAMLECADISNVVDFIFERLSEGKIQ